MQINYGDYNLYPGNTVGGCVVATACQGPFLCHGACPCQHARLTVTPPTPAVINPLVTAYRWVMWLCTLGNGGLNETAVCTFGPLYQFQYLRRRTPTK